MVRKRFPATLFVTIWFNLMVSLGSEYINSLYLYNLRIVMTETEMVQRIRKGDRKAFDFLCREYYAAFISYAKMILLYDGAEDVVQDVLLNVWGNRARLLEERSLQGYILRSIYNRALNKLSKDKSASDYQQWYRMSIVSLTSFYCDPENNDSIRHLYTKDLRDKINDAVMSLPPKCREVFRLSYIEHKSTKEIAAELGVSTSTVSNHIHNALVILREALGTGLLFLFLHNFR